MARRKNVKRIDPRYFLHETVNRNDDGSVLEGCGEMGPEGPMDTSQLTPEEAFTAGMSAARDAIDQALGDPDGPWLPEEGGFSGNGPMGEPAMQETALEEVDFQDTGSGSSPDPQDLVNPSATISRTSGRTPSTMKTGTAGRNSTRNSTTFTLRFMETIQISPMI